MNLPNLALPTRKLLAGLLVVSMASLAVGWTAGMVAASGPTHSVPTPTTPVDKADSNTVARIPQVQANTGSTVTYAGSGTATGTGSGTAVAYPGLIYPGSLGAAPQGTILAGGSGTAAMKADGSDRASALPTATAAALADARAQAQAVATSMGVSLKSIYSVTVTTTDSYAYAVPDCIVPPVPGALESGSAGSSGAPAIAPVPLPADCSNTKTTTPASAQLVVTVVVAYNFA